MLLFVSAALPKITIEDTTIIAVSPQSPLGNKLMGNTVGFTFEINTTKFIIESIQ
jgi:transcription elongation GreA/GreB family factor